MLWKTSKVDRLEAKAQRKAEADKSAYLAEKALREADKAIRADCYYRDNGQCVVCQKRVYLSDRNPLTMAHNHHVIYRSAENSSDEAWNRVTLCIRCHDDEHRHIISITGTADNLTIERRQA